MPGGAEGQGEPATPRRRPIVAAPAGPRWAAAAAVGAPEPPTPLARQRCQAGPSCFSLTIFIRATDLTGGAGGDLPHPRSALHQPEGDGREHRGGRRTL